MIELRDYQELAHKQIIEKLRLNLKTLLVMATGCLSGSTVVQINRGGASRKYSLKELCIKSGNYPFGCKGYRFRKAASNKIRSYIKKESRIGLKDFVEVIYSGVKTTYTLTLENGKALRLTECHKVQTKRGMIALKNLKGSDLVVFDAAPLARKSKIKNRKLYDSHLVMGRFHPYRGKIFSSRRNKFIHRIEKHRVIYEASINGMELEDFQNATYTKNTLIFIDPKVYDIHHIDFDHYNNSPENLVHLTKKAHKVLHSKQNKKNFNQGALGFSKVKVIEYFGDEETFDVVDVNESHNFVANGIVAHNSGKSKTIVSFIDKIKQHYIFILVVKNRKLVNQLAEDTKEFNLDYGVFMANHNDYSLKKEIQVCSIDTIHARGIHPHILAKKDIVLIIDEADQAKSSTYQAMINRYLTRQKHGVEIGRTFLLGLTATPYNCLDFFDTYINPITPKELRDRGFLVDYKYYIPKESVDYSDIIVSKGEWSAIQVSKKLNNPKMIASCFNSWLEYGEDRQTLIFCMDKVHARAFCEYINNYYNKTLARFVYDKTSDDERTEIFNGFESGKIRFLINIRIITRGVDLPCIGTILDCAATLNLNLHIQKLGRGSRKNDFYKDCIVIDPAKNILNNGHFYQEHEISLTAPYKRCKSDLEDLQMRVCEKCFRAAEVNDFGRDNCCPYCGIKNKPLKKKKLSKFMKDKLFMESASEEQIEQKKMINEFKQLLWKKQNLGRRSSRKIAIVLAQHDLVKKHGLDKVMKIAKSIKLSQMVIDSCRKSTYKPLGGMDI